MTPRCILRGAGTGPTFAWIPTAKKASVLAISAESRHLSAAELRRVMDELAQRLPVARARILFKKIDSTLRGNVGAEIAAALDRVRLRGGRDYARVSGHGPNRRRRVICEWQRA